MKTLQVFEPGCDGVFRHVERLCAHLNEAGASTDLLYSSVRGSAGLHAFVSDQKQRGAETHDLQIGPSPVARDIFAMSRLISLCQKNEYDAIHAHSSKAGALVRLASPFLKTRRIFYTPHAYYGMGSQPSIATAFYNTIESALSRIGETINVSHDEARFAQNNLHVSPIATHVIPNPVDADRFTPATPTQRAKARAELGIPADARVIAYAGRFSFQKDPWVAFDAFAHCARADARVHLVYLCKKTLRAEAESFVQREGLADRVTFVDYLEDVRPFYHSANIFLLTSRYEAGWPFALLEAMACNLPIVTSVCPGMSDIEQGGLNQCWAFSAGSRNGCRAALKIALDQPLARPANHREIALRRFSPTACFGEVHRLYRPMLANDPREQAERGIAFSV
jgi:glycosyltransferase involved in cell wall biosynthesis